jgi:hypothetical protein
MTSFPDHSRDLPAIEGFCRPRWDRIAERIEQEVPEGDWQAAWEAVARDWVQRLRDDLGHDYRVYETPNFLILTEAGERVVNDACRSFEEALAGIMERLSGVASDEGFGKHVVLMFREVADYYRYITHFYPDGDHPMSGGVCLSGHGYIHFAFPTPDYSSYGTVLVHELTHALLVQLPIPSWLNEALAMRMEQVICRTETFELDRDEFERHLRHWNVSTMQQFWTGESWGIPGDSFELSYSLAQVLWRKIEVNLGLPREAVLGFVADADFRDGGAAACRQHLGLSLGELIGDFLGDGEWEPKPREHSDS